MGCDSTPNTSGQPYLTLNSKYKIPQYGLGVYEIKGDDQNRKSMLISF